MFRAKKHHIITGLILLTIITFVWGYCILFKVGAQFDGDGNFYGGRSGFMIDKDGIINTLQPHAFAYYTGEPYEIALPDSEWVEISGEGIEFDVSDTTRVSIINGEMVVTHIGSYSLFLSISITNNFLGIGTYATYEFKSSLND